MDKDDKQVKLWRVLHDISRHGNVSRACKAHEMPRRSLYNLIKRDKSVRDQYTKARKEGMR